MVETSVAPDPLEMDLIKAHLVVEHNLDDTIISHYSSASLEVIEEYLNYSLLGRIFETTTNEITEQMLYLDLPYKPQSIIVYYDDGSQEDDIDFMYDIGTKTLYVENTENNITKVEAFVIPKYPNAVNQIRLLLIGNMYEFRNADTAQNLKQVPTGIMFLIDKLQDSVI